MTSPSDDLWAQTMRKIHENFSRPKKTTHDAIGDIIFETIRNATYQQIDDAATAICKWLEEQK